ncbi:hypothetical protein BBK82_15765 [Lentzea guizhouensis]|uniref:PE domain-containing protein n=1 Tax=Lentzea guizhouensis TaxID=1586287 RepID=A0A1B2HHU6_9PSEU|nr:hypothetical protein [Lentzea guizhouensis]ANZ37299.1 hypothetical protein BBK82_15765 [Lentzea guizhouensis]
MTQENAGADAVLGAAATLAAGGAIGAAVGAFKVASAALDRMSSAGPQQFEVNEKTVLDAGRLIQDQAKALNDALNMHMFGLRIPADAHAADRVSADIVEAWNDRLVDNPDSYANRVLDYIKNLNGLGEQLKAAAEQYKLSEEDITATFGPKA